MKSGDEFRREGDKIFGAGSRNGVQITVLVRNPERDLAQPATLHYAEVPEYFNLDSKLAWLGRLGDVTGDEFRKVPLNDAHHWVNLTDGTFEQLLPVCAIGRSQNQAAVHSHASGVKTNCDVYVYSFSRDDLVVRINELIDAYEEAREFVRLGISFDEVTENYQLDSIKWTDTLKQSLKRGEQLVFDERRIREVLYRPFTKLWLYEDDRILSSVRTVSAMFPRGSHTHTSSSRLRTTETSSQRSWDKCSSTSISSDRTKEGLEPFPGGDPDDAGPSTAVRDPGHGSADGSPCSRTADADNPAPDPAPVMGGGSWSRRPTVGRSSEPWPATASPISARSERTSPPEQYPGGNPDVGAVKHGDIRGADNRDSAGSPPDGSGAADQGDPSADRALDLTGGGRQCSSISRSNSRSGSSPPTGSSISAPPGGRPVAYRDGGDPHHRDLEHDLPGTGHDDASGPGIDQGIAADQGHPPPEAILVSSPSNRTRFSVFAVGALPDLHAVDPHARATPRATPRSRA